MPEWMFSPAWWIAFWALVGVGVLLVLYASISSSLRQIEEAEAELDASPYMWHVGNLRILHPGFHDPYDQEAEE